MKHQHTSGSVYVEFLVVFLPLFTLFLGITQIGLALGARLLVEHAASKAARAAIVVLPDDSEDADYQGVPLNRVGTDGKGLTAYRNAPGGGRYETIRMAARYPLSPLSPDLSNFFKSSTSVMEALDKNVIDVTVGIFGWTEFAVGLSFPKGEDEYLATFGPREQITCRITYLFKCAVPVANSLLCRPYSSIDSNKKEILELRGGLMGLVGKAAGWKFLAMQAERELPNQGEK